VDANETVLTPANVVAGSFGKQFTTPVDGQVLAQPVYMAGANITTGSSPGTHNVVFVATEHDSLYAIDAGSGQVLWKDSFLISSPGVTVTSVPSADVNSGDISPQIGITDTPAIDATNGYLYVVAKIKAVYSGETGTAHYVNTLYKVDIDNGTFTSTVIADTTATSNGTFYNAPFTYNSGPYVLGTGDGYVNMGGQNRVYFNSLTQQFRPAVELVNEVVNGQTIEEVVLGSASHGDNGPYHAWMLTYNASTLVLTGVLNTTPNGGLGGIWQGGDGIVSDPEGYFYFETGNGTFDTTLNSAGFPIDGDYGDSFVKVAVDPTTSQTNQNENGWGLKVVDYFTPYDQASLSGSDEDLGSGGPTILPDYSASDPNPQPASATYPELLVGGGKDGVVYLINRENMGKYSPTTNKVLQQLGTSTPSNSYQSGAVGGILSTPGYFNGQVYITSGYGGPIDAFSITSAKLSVTADFTTPDSFGNLDGSPTISADGTANGIVWALERGSGELRAYNAANLSEIYNSSTLANNADAPGSIMKFTVPVVANGDVYVGTGNSLVMYGLDAPPTAPPPAPTNLTITSVSGSEVSLSWTNNANSSSDIASAFNVERSTDGVTFTPIGTSGVDQTTYVDTTVQPFTTYYYRVDASNSVGTSAYSNVVSAQTLGQPAVGGGDGLLGKYYTFDGTPADFDINASGTPLLTRVDPTIDFNWNTTSPAPVVPQTDFEVRWTGELQAQYSENYTFSTDSDDGVELLINGQVVISDFTFHPPTIDTSATPLALQAGKSYSIEVDYFQGGGGAQMELSWSSPHTALEVIPQSQLFSGSAPAAPTKLQVLDISGTQTNLTWTTNSTDEEGYEVDRMLGSSGTFSAVAFLPPGSNQYLDTGLTPGNSYAYEVRATNFVADSAWSSQAAVTMAVLPDAISSAMPTTVTTNSIAMVWTNNDDNGTEIRIFRLSGPGGNPVFITTLFFSTATDPADEPSAYVDTGPGGLGLLPGTVYGYEIECGNLAGFSAYSSFTTQTLTNAPTQLAAVPANGQVTLSWSAPKGTDTYNIYRGTSPGGEDATPLATGVTGTSFVDSSAVNGRQYYYEVTAVDSGGESAPSAEASATPQAPTGIALPPTNVSATAGDATVALVWQAAVGASSYNIYRGTVSGTEVLVASGVSGPSYGDTGLTDGVTYYYEITSVNQFGESALSSEVAATPQTAAPPTPVNVTATVGNGQVGLTWSPASDAQTYDIYRSTSPGDEVIYQQGIVGTSFTDTSVTNGVTYYYQVSAGNGVGESNLSQEVSATPLPPLPPVPASLKAAALNSSEVSLSWTEPPGAATSFTLERSVDGVNFAPLTTLDGTASSYVDAAGLDPTTTYSYRLEATNLAGNSAWSSVATAAPKMAISAPWADEDIGSPPLTGSAYEVDGAVYVNGTGNDIWNSSDQFHFVYVPLSGNGTIVAHVAAQGQTDPWAKAGVMFRNSLAAGSVFADMVLTPGYGAAFQYRDSSGNLGNTDTGVNTYFAPDWVKLVRSGSTFTGYVSSDGVTWTSVGSDSLTMGSTVYIGLCDTSHNASLISGATFNEVSVNGSTTPAAPSGLSAIAASGTSVALAWTNHDKLSFANEIYREDPGSTTFTWIATVPATATAYLDTGLTPGANYSYQVLASNTVGASPSNTATVTTPVPPLAVSALQAASVTTTSALLSWVLNSSNDTGVQVWRRSGGAGDFSLVTTLPAGSTSYVDDGLQPGTLYEYHVSAVNLAGSSPAADTGLTTLPAPPEVTATTQAGQVQLSWTASTGAVAYNVYRGLKPGGEGGVPYATVENATSFTDNGVTSGQPYYYVVTAVDFSGESAPSAEVAGNQTLASISVSPSPATIAAGATQQFTAVAYDQNGVALATQPTWTWSVIGDGMINSSGLYTPPYANGSATVQAASGLTTGSASVSYSGLAEWDSVANASWDTNGDWVDSASGTNLAPPGLRGVAGDTVLFGSATGTAVTLDGASPSVAAMTFSNSTNSYTVSQGSGGALHLDNGGSSASVTVSSGSHTISAPVVLDSSLLIAPASGSALTISGAISGMDASLTVSGQGTVNLSGTNSYTGGTIVASGTLVAASAGAIPSGTSLIVGAGGVFVFGGISGQTAVPSAVPNAAGRPIDSPLPIGAESASSPIASRPAVAPQTLLTRQASSTKLSPPNAAETAATVLTAGYSPSAWANARDTVLQSLALQRSLNLVWAVWNGDLDFQKRSRFETGPMSLPADEVFARLGG